MNRFLLILFHLFGSLAAAQEAKPLCDPKATAEWLTTIFTVSEGKILVAGKEPEKYREARLRFSRPVEIRPYREKVIVDQEGLYPLSMGPMEDGYEFFVSTPFYPYLDEMPAPDGLPGLAPSPKGDAINERGLRTIAEILHAHFTKSAGEPEGCRVLDKIGYPSEHYMWRVGTQSVTLTAYDGNDSNGLVLRIAKSTDLDAFRKMAPTREEVFEGWGDMMPHRQPARQE